MTNEPTGEVLWDAEFNPTVRTYWLLSGALILFATIIGIPLLILWFAIGNYLTGRYLSYMRCTLTTRSLQFSKGMFVRVEKTVPLDKITDIGLVHGPIMRYLGLRALSIETAGQSGPGALVRVTGIVDTEDFRQAVLSQRDKVVETLAGSADTTRPAAGAEADHVLVDIRDTLRRIEDKLGPRD